MPLVILAHPNFDQSIANKTIVRRLNQHHPNLEIRYLHQLYSNYQIDVAAEQAALLRHNIIILQYPMYWFNMPAILKIWFDAVFSYQFAYGSKGNKLKNKLLMVSLTVGQPEKNFIQSNGTHLIDQFLKSIQHSAEYAQMRYQTPHILYDVSIVSSFTPENIQFRAESHGLSLSQWIHKITASTQNI